MSQSFSILCSDVIETIQLPNPQEKILPGIAWGRFQDFFTPAYWYTQAWVSEKRGFHDSQRLGTSLLEELAICLLGGYGMVAEHGLAAFEQLRGYGFFSGRLPSEEEIMRILQTPLYIGGRQVHYRYPRQRSKYLYQAIKRLKGEEPPKSSDREFRNWLMSFNGIGPKTASWITRNWLNSDNIAIIDIHIQRSGMIIGLFGPHLNPSKDYFEMEKRFLNFASAIRVRASVLDAVIWSHMRMMKKIALRVSKDVHAYMLN